MQTFLPYPSFKESANTLDYRRLGKQRVEALQIVRALTDVRYGWQHHPAVNMWRGHLQSLVEYGLVMCETWRVRGFNDTVADQLYEYWEDVTIRHPAWLGRPDVHQSHRAMLLRKDRECYEDLFASELKELDAITDYVWPTV